MVKTIFDRLSEKNPETSNNKSDIIRLSCPEDHLCEEDFQKVKEDVAKTCQNDSDDSSNDCVKCWNIKTEWINE